MIENDLWFHIATVIAIIATLYGLYRLDIFINDLKRRKAGKDGESNLRLLLALTLPPWKFKKLRNVFISNKKDEAEIDMILFSPYGIFIVEVKNFSGSVEGNATDKKWVQYKKHDGREMYFHNPTKQADFHARVIKRLTGCKKVYSYVVFVGSADIDTDATNVFSSKWGIIWQLWKIARGEEVLPDHDKYFEVVKNNNIKSRKARKEYFKRISEKYNK